MSELNGVTNLNEKNFDEVVTNGVTIVDFWAPWCMPCIMQGPILEAVSEKVKGKARVCKLNVDENEKTAQKFEINSIPTVLIFKDGKVEKRFIGVQNENTLIQSIQ